MTDGLTEQQQSAGAGLLVGAPFHPRLGDLVADLAHQGRIGVVIALPGDTSASYQLRPPGGGDDWRARADGATLRLVPPRVSHVVPMRRDAEYDPRADQAALSAVVHFEDGSSSETVVILTAVQLEHWYAQIGRLLASRDAVRQRR